MHQLCCGDSCRPHCWEDEEVWKHCWTHFSLKTPGAVFCVYVWKWWRRPWLDLFSHDEAFADSPGTYHVTPFQKKTTGISLGYPCRTQHGSSITSLADPGLWTLDLKFRHCCSFVALHSLHLTTKRFLFTPACACPVCGGGHGICVFRRVSLDRDSNWSRAKPLAWTEIVSV